MRPGQATSTSTPRLNAASWMADVDPAERGADRTGRCRLAYCRRFSATCTHSSRVGTRIRARSPALTIEQVVQDGQAEGSGLAAAGLAQRDRGRAASARVECRLLLDLGRVLVARGLDAGQDGAWTAPGMQNSRWSLFLDLSDLLWNANRVALPAALPGGQTAPRSARVGRRLSPKSSGQPGRP